VPLINQQINPPAAPDRRNTSTLPLISEQPSPANSNNLVQDLRVAAESGLSQTQFVQLSPVVPETMQIIPGLPDRNSGKIYRLQVGAFTEYDIANRTAALIRNAGFEVLIEFSGAIYRVMATGIPSADVYPASIRLGSLGFAQVWVRE
jgi:cell division protein FtsN